jgi:very-short-patch-repair endonuclease
MWVAPFLGTEALAGGELNRHQLRTRYAAVFPGVYAAKNKQLTLQGRIAAAWLWSQRRGVVCGLSAAGLHGARCIDADSPVELVFTNTRPPQGIRTRNDTVLADEVQEVLELEAPVTVTTPARTAYDLGRRAPLGQAVARLDALAGATGLRAVDVLQVAGRHRHVKGLRQLEKALDLFDPGAESPKESWLRLLLVNAGFPKPRTQIPVFDESGWPEYYLDMGWEEQLLAVEYEGDQHRLDRARFARDIRRLEKLNALGWLVVRVVAENRPEDIVRRVQNAWLQRVPKAS